LAKTKTKSAVSKKAAGGRGKEKSRAARSNRSSILMGVVLLIGLGLIAYPSFSDWYNSFHQSRAISSYTEAVASTDVAEFDAIFEAAEAYNKTLLGDAGRYMMTEEEVEE